MEDMEDRPPVSEVIKSFKKLNKMELVTFLHFLKGEPDCSQASKAALLETISEQLSSLSQMWTKPNDDEQYMREDSPVAHGGADGGDYGDDKRGGDKDGDDDDDDDDSEHESSESGSEGEATFSLKVKETFNERQTHIFNVTVNDTVKQLKFQIQGKFGYKVKDQQLDFGTVRMQDDFNLTTYNLDEGDEVQLQLKLGGGMGF